MLSKCPRSRADSRSTEAMTICSRCRRAGGNGGCVRPDFAQVRIGLVESEQVLVGDGPDQGQVRGVLAGAGGEGAQ
jgi:hypothetical protein